MNYNYQQYQTVFNNFDELSQRIQHKFKYSVRLLDFNPRTTEFCPNKIGCKLFFIPNYHYKNVFEYLLTYKTKFNPILNNIRKLYYYNPSLFVLSSKLHKNLNEVDTRPHFSITVFKKYDDGFVIGGTIHVYTDNNGTPESMECLIPKKTPVVLVKL